MFRKHNLF